MKDHEGYVYKPSMRVCMREVCVPSLQSLHLVFAVQSKAIGSQSHANKLKDQGNVLKAEGLIGGVRGFSGLLLDYKLLILQILGPSGHQGACGR